MSAGLKPGAGMSQPVTESGTIRSPADDRLRRVVGGLFLLGAVAFAAAATLLSSAFEWPDILREPANVVLPEFTDAGTGLVWIWFATAWTYAILLAPMLLLPTALGQRDDPVLRAATFVGSVSVLMSLIGFLRWVFVVPPLARAYDTADAGGREAIDAAWTAQHQFGGALLGEHLGQVLVIVWTVSVCVHLLRSRALPRWLAVSGLGVSGIYLLNQGDILATAIPSFPVWDLAGLLGSTGWGLWVAALGITLLRRGTDERTTTHTRSDTSDMPTPRSSPTETPTLH
jgi:drug/metabolite transporter (DMT)-like permease